VGFALLALGLVVAAQMALWPLRGTTRMADNSLGRLVAGFSAVALLVLLAARVARRTDSPTTAGLGVALVLTGIGFLAVRWPDPESRGRIIQYAAVVGSAASIPILLIAELLPKSTGRSFAPAVVSLPAGVAGLVTDNAAYRPPADGMGALRRFFCFVRCTPWPGTRRAALSGPERAPRCWRMSLWDLSKAGDGLAEKGRSVRNHPACTLSGCFGGRPIVGESAAGCWYVGIAPDDGPTDVDSRPEDSPRARQVFRCRRR
jgi:hypothetical protein